MSKKVAFMCSMLAIVVTLACTSAAPDTAAAEAELEANALSWFDHYNKGDADAVTNLYADDAVLMPPGVPAMTGRAAIKAYFDKDIATVKGAGLSIRNTAVTGKGVSGDTGWVSGTYTVVDGAGATVDSGSYLSVHRRTDGAWPYTRDIWNSDRAPAAAPPAPEAANEK